MYAGHECTHRNTHTHTTTSAVTAFTADLPSCHWNCGQWYAYWAGQRKGKAFVMYHLGLFFFSYAAADDKTWRYDAIVTKFSFDHNSILQIISCSDGDKQIFTHMVVVGLCGSGKWPPGSKAAKLNYIVCKLDFWSRLKYVKFFLMDCNEILQTFMIRRQGILPNLVVHWLFL